MAAKKKAKAKAKKAPVKKSARKAAAKPKAVLKNKAKAAKAKPAAKTTTLAGKAAPDFSMPLDDGRVLTLAGLKGKSFVLYFYPKDDTPGCTAEACAFRDMLPDFTAAGATVIGVSKDNSKSHQKFRQKFGLNFPLASDEDKVCERYGVWKEKNMYGRTYMGVERSTFLVDADGIVRAEWRKVSVPGHADEVKKALQTL
jgi:peroxiredoxin Q/BCP